MTVFIAFLHNRYTPVTSVADPGSKRFPDPDPHQRIKYYNLNKFFQALGIMIRDVPPRPGSRGQKGTGSLIQFRNTAVTS
jgi:hypothetical protein